MFEEFKEAVFQPDNYSYIVKKKFDSGNTVEVEFYIRESSNDSPLYIEVALRSYAKRKHKNSPEFYYSIKGKDGLRPAVWATDLLLKFPAFMLSHGAFAHKNRVVYTIYWSDSRRRDIYHKWLSRYGFYFWQDIDGKCLTKIFDR